MSLDDPDVWMPLYIGDWDSKTRHLSCEQDGAYFRLIRHYWKTGPIPDDDAQLARIAGLEIRRWKVQRAALARFFTVEAGVWRNGRADREKARWTEKRRVYIQRAQAGGRAKAAKSSASSTLNRASSTTKAVLKSCTPSPSVEEESFSSSHSLYGEGFRFANEEIRAEAVALRGEDWVRSWLDQCGWRDLPQPSAILAPRELTADRVRSELRAMLRGRGVVVALEMERKTA